MTRDDTIKRTAIAAALLAAFGPAHSADADDLAAQTRPESEFRLGVGYADSAGRRFGQYNGINESGVYALVDLDVVTRDDATGTWLKLYARNLGLDSRQILFEHNRQGHWGYFLEYSRIPRYEPYEIRTAVTGIGTPTLRIPAAPTAGGLVNLDTQRDRFGFGFDKILSPNWDLKVRFRTEEKDGARIFGRGTPGAVAGFAGNFEFMPEPIDSVTHQLEVILGYTGRDLQLSGGYYGTAYNNKFNGINTTGGVAALAGFTPIGLPPDNSSHQIHLSGGYNFTTTTRGTFKVAHAKIRQDDAFVSGAGVPLAPGIGTNLQARLDTTLAQVGLTSRPLPKLTLRADLRYDDRSDRTPVLRYFTGVVTTADGNNEPRSIRTTRGLVEAGYLLPMAFRLTAGVEREDKTRNTSAVRVVSFRESTEETSFRIELRRSVSDTLTGAISYVRSDREGSPFLLTTETTGARGSNLIAPLHLADREREKLRLSLNWTPIEPLSIQFFFDEARDDYTGRDGSGLGPRSGEARNYSLDMSWQFTDKWQATAWYNWNNTRAEQTTCQVASAAGVCPATGANPVWRANVSNASDSFGLGLRGKVNGGLELGADLSYTDITDTFEQVAITPSTSVVPVVLPEITNKLTRLNFFAKYALQKHSGVRLDYIFDRFSTNDWTWTSWRYLDGTVVSQEPVQKVHFIGLSYYHRWR